MCTCTHACLNVCTYTYVHLYTYACERACRRAGVEGSRGLEAQFCSVNPWRRARGVYHPASEFVVPRLVTSASVFRTRRFYLIPPPPSHHPGHPCLPPSAAIYLHNGGHAGDVHAPPRIQGRVPETPRDQNRFRGIPRRRSFLERALLKANARYSTPKFDRRN